MDISKIELILANEYGLHTCPICGTPYEPYHKRQKTCASPECIKAYHAEYTKDYAARLKAEDPETARRKKREAQQRYRAKMKALEEREKALKELGDRWKKQEESEARLSEAGLDYGKLQTQKTLASVPKIDVNMGGNDNDGICDQDEC